MLMPETWVPPAAQRGAAGGSRNRRTPRQVPDPVTPQLPGFATAGLSVAIVLEKPSVHPGVAVRADRDQVGRTADRLNNRVFREYANGANWDLTMAVGAALGIDTTSTIGAVALPRPR